MPDTMTIGFWLFWLGASAAYAGTMWLPSLAKSRKAALGVLALLAISGWTAMLAASKDGAGDLPKQEDGAQSSGAIVTPSSFSLGPGAIPGDGSGWPVSPYSAL